MQTNIQKKDDEETRRTGEYSVTELLEELLDDESWEKDPAFRAAAVAMLRDKIIPKA